MPESSRTSSNARVASLPCIGNWCAVSLLGQGRWSRVYRARPRGTASDAPADYAVKLAAAAEHCDHDTARHLLMREVLLARSVSHTHLISILSSHLNQAPYYLVMPYLEGTTVERLLERHGTIATPLALWIARQAAEAVQALHRHGWLHGDIKPSNLFVADEGHVTLLDLGLARSFAAGQARPGRLAGTLAYLPPEAYASLVDLGPAADVYALGVTLYRMLTGRLPFDIQQPAELAEAHLHQIPPDPRQFNPRLPQAVVSWITAMLAKQPHQRPMTDDLIRGFARLEILTFTDRTAA
jgi:eukaryotic-like serine/threonine-protein kinase